MRTLSIFRVTYEIFVWRQYFRCNIPCLFDKEKGTQVINVVELY